jgi:hypothetical protein
MKQDFTSMPQRNPGDVQNIQSEHSLPTLPPGSPPCHQMQSPSTTTPNQIHWSSRTSFPPLPRLPSPQSTQLHDRLTWLYCKIGTESYYHPSSSLTAANYYKLYKRLRTSSLLRIEALLTKYADLAWCSPTQQPSSPNATAALRVKTHTRFEQGDTASWPSCAWFFIFGTSTSLGMPTSASDCTAIARAPTQKDQGFAVTPTQHAQKVPIFGC